MNSEYKKELDTQGYVLIRDFLCHKEKKLLSSAVQLLDDREDVPGEIMKYYESSVIDNNKILNRIENFIDKKEAFVIKKIEKKSSKLLSLVMGEDYFLFKDKINFKLSGGGGFSPHQDYPAFTRFIDKEMFNVMIPIDDTTIDNGCLCISNKPFEKELIPHSKGKALENTYEKYNWIPIQANAGDLLIFSSFLLHMSRENLSGNRRRCIFFTYNCCSEGDLRSEYFDFKRKAFPPLVERDENHDYSQWINNLARKIL
ncbi:phytanoyl-CoA dioxygenase [Photorhabdus sp. HUG-39]|uniref:Phytanoyl-CoA dioxygenase family protein n=1 Tax=Photorhabdus kayaii TaxID=230088 RepID=A0ABX0AZ55_9GAMM|nr:MULTISPECIES: phytanoyl-CoA dioxygenase family protein [Photorhabdus]MDB6367608.1 phytanoyl-CoA dioxygenase family protein [Photorhabdus bodei]NDL12056.1 phytanoyl-CoA dioxygenase family protein [Photorhabdus kayaii]NDL25689.1 phytanoyl-CoA dioxygenase family protein [Photorhabdus kayaii]RAX09858.1 phytanoyl-CoA dioxygenase [Photorhabdus sp. HUG-39]